MTGRMKRLAPLFVAICLAHVVAESAHAQPGHEVALPGEAWSVAREARRCVAIRNDGETGRLEFEQKGWVNWVNVIYHGASSPRRDEWGRGHLAFEPAGLTLGKNGSLRRGGDTGAGAVTVYAVTPTSLTRFEQPQTMTIAFEGRERASLAIEPLGEVIASLESCHDSLLRDWGVDPDHMRSLEALPEPSNNPGSWVTVRDYPTSARASGIGGRVTFRLHVDPDGRVADCAIVVSSGTHSLDDTVCELLRRRARFEPARSIRGEPVPSSYVSEANFDPRR